MLLSRDLKKHEKTCISKNQSHTFATLFQNVSAIKIRPMVTDDGAQRARRVMLRGHSAGSEVKNLQPGTDAEDFGVSKRRGKV